MSRKEFPVWKDSWSQEWQHSGCPRVREKGRSSSGQYGRVRQDSGHLEVDSTLLAQVAELALTLESCAGYMLEV